MPLFWTLAALMIVVTLCVLTWPLLRHGRRRDAPDASSASLAVLRDQKRALDAEYDAGTITATERDAAITELTQRLAEENREPPAPPSTSPAPSSPARAWIAASLLIVLVPVAALVLYQRLGSPSAVNLAKATPGHDVTEAQIIAMVDTLAQRLKQHPEDGDGWVLLGRSYQALERFGEAADAYEHAAALIKDDPNLLADYADVLAVVQGRRLAGKPAALVDRALAIDPTHRKALALAATAALEAHDLAASLVYWRRLAAQLPAGSDEVRQVTDVIAEIESAQREGKGTAAASARRAPAAAPAATPPRSASVKPDTSSISGRVDLAPAFASKVALSDTVFIFARAAEGPRMPLAVLRIPAKDLPRDFVLDDSMAMAPGMKLSSTPAVIVEARVSKSGGAIAQPGDLFGRSAQVKPGTSGLAITIDQVVP
jgi:cytochrome c-type biogenesis protein CcmH